MATRLPLNCTVYDGGNVTVSSPFPGAAQVHYVRTHCTNDGVTITGEVTSREDLPPFSIQDPYPTVGGCTVDSIVAPYFTVSDLQLNITNSNEDPSDAEISFLLGTLSDYLAAVTQPLNISSTPDSLPASDWHTCSNYLAWRIPECDFRYDFGANRIEVHQEWICSDKGDHRE